MSDGTASRREGAGGAVARQLPTGLAALSCLQRDVKASSPAVYSAGISVMMSA